MNFSIKKSIKSFIAASTAMAMALSLSAFVPEKSDVYAASDCVIDSSKTYQIIRGFGGINHPEWTGQDMTDAQRKTAFGNGDNELGLTILRVFVNPDSNQWKLAVPTAKYASDNGVTVFASPWEPPANLAESGGSNGKLHLPKSNYGAYAQHLNNFGSYMKNNGVDLYSISVQNEPDFAEDWTYWSTDETTDFLANYGDKITSTRLMSPESFQYAPLTASWVPDGGKKFYKKIMENSKAFANCDLFGTHFYGTARDWMDYPELENCGKEIWMTEVYVPNSDQDSANRYPEALDVSENIHNGLVVGNMSAYTWWYIRRHYGLMTEDGKISKRGYCMAQYSKYVRPGAVRISAVEQPADNVFISAYKNTNGDIAVVAINKSETGYSQSFSLKNESIKEVTRYRTSANENLAKTANMEYNGNSFYAQLPAQSVSTFVIKAGAAEVKPDENGYYFHDTFESDNCSWEARGANKLELSGRAPYMGDNALVTTGRTAIWNGMVKSVDMLKAGESYSFSACVSYFDSDADTEGFSLTLEYTDSNGDTKYKNIASKTVSKGQWAQLANTSFTIPSDAKNPKLVVETSSDTMNFYIDEVIAATKGTVIEGPIETIEPTTEPTTEAPVSTTQTTESVKPGANDYYFHDSFEDGNCDWEARGGNKLELSGRAPYMGTNALISKERTAAWNGVQKSLDMLKAGESYSFSVCVSYLDGDVSTENFSLTLQYTDASGETCYKNIDIKTAVKGEWVQLANTNYTIPSDAINPLLIVETSSGTMNFYIDEAIAATKGTVINGPKEIAFMVGDLNNDGKINVFDLCIAKRGVSKGFTSNLAALAADVTENTITDVTDVKYLQQFLSKKITEFPKETPPVTEVTPAEYMNSFKSKISEYAPSGMTDEKAGVEYGTLTKYQYYSTTAERMTDVNVLLPPGYNKNEKYPVLYALHGFWENEDSLAEMSQARNILGNLIASGEAEKMIIVFPYIYTSKTQESCSSLDLQNSLAYDNFINDLTTDLMPYINENFSVKTGRENTAITGFSMGGRESLFIGLTRSDLFSYVGAACPAPGLTPGADLSMHPGQLQESQLKPAFDMPKFIMITGGGQDGVVSSSPSSYDQILTRNGIDHLWHYVSTGQHNASSVQPHFYNYLKAIFK